MNKTVYNIAFVGGGINSAVGETHKIACQMDGRFKLVAGCFSQRKDVNQETADAWDVSTEHLYSSYVDLLKAEKNNVDAVVVLTPTDSHNEIISAVLQEGYAVISEKSLATSVAEGQAIADCVKKSKGFFCLTYNYTGYPMVRELKQMIADGKLGVIQQVQIEMPQEGFIRLSATGERPRPQEGRLRDSEIPKISLDLGSHLHSLVYFLTGKKPLKIVADEATYGLFPQIVDNVGALVKYEDGIKAQVWISKTALGCRNGLRFRIYGSKGSAEWYQMDPEIIKYCDINGKISLLDRTSDVRIANLRRYNRFKAGHPAGFIEAFANYYDDIADCLDQFNSSGHYVSEYVFDVNTSLDSLRMMDAATRSAKSGKWEDV